MNAQQFVQRNNVDWIQSFKLYSYNPSTNLRVPFNLAGCELKMTLVGDVSGMPELILDVDDVGGIFLPPDPTTGEGVINVPASRMWTLEAGMYHGDMLIFGNDASITYAFTAELEIIAGTTPPA